MNKPDELQALISIMDTYEQEVGLSEGHRAAVERLWEMLTLLRYQQPQRHAVKQEGLRREIARLRAKVNQLKTHRTKPRERFKLMQDLTDTLNAIRQVLERG